MAEAQKPDMRDPARRQAAVAGVYFVQAGDREGRIKIGWSRDVRFRVNELKTASPYPLRLLLVIPGPPQEERKLHRQFQHERCHLEWFVSGGDLEAFVRERLGQTAGSDRCELCVDDAIVGTWDEHIPSHLTSAEAEVWRYGFEWFVNRPEEHGLSVTRRSAIAAAAGYLASSRPGDLCTVDEVASRLVTGSTR